MTSVWQPRQPRTESRLSGLPGLLGRLLAVRGVAADNVDAFLNPSLKHMRDPLALDGMDVALERLVQAYKNKEKVAVYADFDLDGTSGLALLYDALKAFGFHDVVFYQPLRLSEGYGLHVSAVEKLAAEGVKVIVTVDVGITANEAADVAKKLDVDLIITDHHLPKEKLPDAYVIVNPNKGSCRSGLNHLSGSGVAFYLVLALKRRLEKEGQDLSSFDPKKLLDCFVIGTLTDMVPLVDENRVLVRHGLLQLQKTSRPGLKQLMVRLGLFGRDLSSQDVAIGLAPKLNALSRMETNLMARDVFMIQSENEAQSVVDTILQNNEMRKYLQREALNEAQRMADEKGCEGALFLYSKGFHKGVIGLIATQLGQDKGIPTFIGSLDDEGFIHGSARTPEGSGVNLVEALESLSSLLVRSGGHAAAAGFVLREAYAEEFERGLKQLLTEVARESVVHYDTDADLNEIDLDFMSWYNNLEPFGKEFPPALIRLPHVQISELSELKGGHLRLKLQQGSATHSAVAFNCSREKNSLNKGSYVETLVEPQWNYFRGDRRLQLLIKDIKTLS